MDTKNIKFVEVSDFIQLGGATYEIVEKFNQLVATGIVDIYEIKLITINYDTSKANTETGPVRIYLANGLVVALNLTAGYSGSGPSDLVKVLELCEIEFDKNDILSKNETVNLRYIKDKYACYQFLNPDGSYEYSM